jgi:hypothetical protein
MEATARSATVVVTHHLLPDQGAEYERWQAGINGAAARFDGFQGAQVVAPSDDAPDHRVVVYRFDGAAHLHAWLESTERRDWIERGTRLFAEPPVQHTVATAATETTVTMVASHRVAPGREADYRAWQTGIDAAVARFPGFVASEMFEPVPGVQPDFVVVFRFADTDSLEVWLRSTERGDWLERAAPLLSGMQLSRVGGGLAGWFPVGSNGAISHAVAPRWKQAMVVLLALYPTVMALGWLQRRWPLDVGVPVRMFASNLVSVAILTWLLMPLTTRALQRWLDPRASPSVTAGYAGVIVASYALLVLGFS